MAVITDKRFCFVVYRYCMVSLNKRRKYIVFDTQKEAISYLINEGFSNTFDNLQANRVSDLMFRKNGTGLIAYVFRGENRIDSTR